MNGEIAMCHQVEEAGGVKWLFIETDDGYVGYVKMDYCCPLKRRRCVVAHCSALVVLIAPVELEAAIPLLCPYLVEISLFRTKLS